MGQIYEKYLLMDCTELGCGQLVIFDEKCKKATLGCRVSAAHLQWSTSRTDLANYANTRSKTKTNTIIAPNNYTYMHRALKIGEPGWLDVPRVISKILRF